MQRLAITLAVITLVTPRLSAQSDSAYRAMQVRGTMAMGVDQKFSTHRFDALPTGGRIELQADTTDTAAIGRIRKHLQEITGAFGRGDFSTPAFVHMGKAVPGTAVMAAKKDVITYQFHPLPRGGEVVMSSGDAEAIQAIHEFLAFQRQEHHAGGRAY
jgi:hypothetical protein